MATNIPVLGISAPHSGTRVVGLRVSAFFSQSPRILSTCYSSIILLSEIPRKSPHLPAIARYSDNSPQHATKLPAARHHFTSALAIPYSVSQLPTAPHKSSKFSHNYPQINAILCNSPQLPTIPHTPRHNPPQRFKTP